MTTNYSERIIPSDATLPEAVRQQFKLPPVRPIEEFQQAGRRTAILILFCPVHLEAIWQMDLRRDIYVEDALGPALSHFSVERDPDGDGVCHPGVTIGWDFDLDFRFRYDYRDGYAKADAAVREAAEAAEATARDAEVTTSESAQAESADAADPDPECA